MSEASWSVYVQSLEAHLKDAQVRIKELEAVHGIEARVLARCAAAERLVSYILDDQVKRLDRDVLRNMAQRVRDEAKDELVPTTVFGIRTDDPDFVKKIRDFTIGDALINTIDALTKIAEAARDVRTSWIGTEDITSTEEQRLLDALAGYEKGRA